MADRPEISAELNTQRRCIIITVVGGTKSTTFRIADSAETLWSEESPCPAWAKEAVRTWSRTPPAIALFEQLARLLGEKAPDKGTEGTTVVDRRRS